MKNELMREVRRFMCLMVILSMVLSPSSVITYAEVDVAAPLVTQNKQMINAQAQTAPLSSGSETEADKLLSKYFKRIDAYLKDNQYRAAKNELQKVYLIDPSNMKAREYATRLDKAEQDKVKADEGDKMQKEALLSAEKNMKGAKEVEQAFQRLESKRVGESWTQEGTYTRPGEVNLDEFERLQSLGIDKYRQEVVAEAARYFKQENYDKAISRYKDALAVDPGNMQLKEMLNEVEKERELRMDDVHKTREKIEDLEFMQEVTKSAMGIDDYRRGMEGRGYATAIVGKKPTIRPSIYDQMQIPVTADFRDVDLVSVLNFLSDYTGINIIASQAITSENRPVTARFKELPLDRALRYLIKGQGLAFRIDDDLIWVATIEEMDSEELETRIYYLEKGSGVFTTFSNTNMGSLGSSGGSASVSDRKSIKDLIEEAVPFPPGGKVVFDDRTGALIVTNTPTNLEKIEKILYTVDESPQQILIESRFIEVNMEEWESLGFEMDLDSPIYTSSKKKTAILSASDYDFTGVANAISSETGGLNLAFGGLLTDPQYTMFLNAVNRLEKTKTLSAPKITTINNQTATIKVVTEEVFPTRFEVSLIQQDLNGDGDLDDAGETEFANVPQDFVTRDIGIILQVTPSVGIDKKTITLSIVPEVSSVSDTPAKFPVTGYDSNGEEVNQSSGTPNLPRFTTSTLSTTVVLESGQTAVLGGLIKETRGTTEEKVPFLGDIPYLGFFFRSKQDTTNRTNLIIFITGRVVSSK